MTVDARYPVTEAGKTRARWLLAVHDGTVTAGDLIAAAAQDQRSPLRKITVRTLAEHMLGVRRQGDRVAERLRAATGSGVRLDVRWLLDPRADGRVRAFADALLYGHLPTPSERWPW